MKTSSLTNQLSLVGGSNGGVHVGPVVGIGIVVLVLIAGAFIVISRRGR